jgi:CheY-like chemotaxis protein
MNNAETDLNDFVAEQERAFARLLGPGIALRVAPASKPARVALAADVVRQLVTSLLEQARLLVPGGGLVQVLIEYVDVDETHALLQPGARRGEFVRLTVSDNGPGLRPEGLRRLLEQPTGAAGPAMMLSVPVMAGIVQRQRGWLEATSQEGYGTEFRIYFPSAATMKETEAWAERTAILLVDDEQVIRQMVKHVLERASYEVIEAENGVEALSIWEANKERVKLLLTDLVMPDGVTGRELAQRLQRAKPGLRVIYTSGYDLDDAAVQDTRMGVRFLQKPYDMRRLLETVQAAVTWQSSAVPAGVSCGR